MKTAPQIAKKETPTDRKAKEQALAEKANKWTDSSSPQEQSWVEDGSGKQRQKVTLRREKGALHKRKQSY